MTDMQNKESGHQTKGVQTLLGDPRKAIIRTLMLSAPCAALFTIVLNMGMNGVYIGMVIASWVSSTIAFIWARYFITGLKQSMVPA